MAPCIPVKKLAHFVLCKKTEVNKTHHLIPEISTAILGVMEPHSKKSIRTKIISEEM
jgi:hypothetical protein